MKIIRKIEEARVAGVKYTPYEKVDMHENGSSPIAIKLCGDGKLLDYYRIACDRGYVNSATDFLNEIKARGLSVPTNAVFPGNISQSGMSSSEFNTFKDEIKKILESVYQTNKPKFADVINKICIKYFGIYNPTVNVENYDNWYTTMSKWFVNPPLYLAKNVPMIALFNGIKNKTLTYDQIKDFFTRDYDLFVKNYLYGALNLRLFLKRWIDDGRKFDNINIFNTKAEGGRLAIELRSTNVDNSPYAYFRIGLYKDGPYYRPISWTNEKSFISDYVLNSNQNLVFGQISIEFRFAIWTNQYGYAAAKNVCECETNNNAIFESDHTLRQDIIDRISTNTKIWDMKI